MPEHRKCSPQRPVGPAHNEACSGVKAGNHFAFRWSEFDVGSGTPKEPYPAKIRGATRLVQQAVDLPGLPGAMDAMRKTRRCRSLRSSSSRFPQGAHSPLENAETFSSAPWKTGSNRRAAGPGLPQIHSLDGDDVFIYIFDNKSQIRPLTNLRGTLSAMLTARVVLPVPPLPDAMATITSSDLPRRRRRLV